MGSSAMTVSGTRRWRLELVSQISELVKRHGGSDGDSMPAVVVGDDFDSRLCDGVDDLVVAFNFLVLNLAV